MTQYYVSQENPHKTVSFGTNFEGAIKLAQKLSQENPESTLFVCSRDALILFEYQNGQLIYECPTMQIL